MPEERLLDVHKRRETDDVDCRDRGRGGARGILHPPSALESLDQPGRGAGSQAGSDRETSGARERAERAPDSARRPGSKARRDRGARRAGGISGAPPGSAKRGTIDRAEPCCQGVAPSQERVLRVRALLKFLRSLPRLRDAQRLAQAGPTTPERKEVKYLASTTRPRSCNPRRPFSSLVNVKESLLRHCCRALLVASTRT